MADTMNRSDLVSAIAASTGQTQTAVNGVLDALFAELSTNVAKGVKVSIPGWLSVERTHRAARAGRNPATGEAIQIPGGYGVKVSAGSKLLASTKYFTAPRFTRRGVRPRTVGRPFVRLNHPPATIRLERCPG